uniref:Uncharacterized protein n=1 Tax=Amphimedon queenslandica TaxID=400682 RepID=A0A1X7VNV2_AMPQE
MEHVFTLAQRFVLASLVFSSFLYPIDTTMLVLDCRSGDTTVISVQCGPQLKETLCEVEYKPIKTSRSVYVERPLGVSTLYKKRLLPFMVHFSTEHVFTLAQRFVLASLVFSSFLYSTDTTMLVLDCRSGDTTVISVQCGPQLKETLC